MSFTAGSFANSTCSFAGYATEAGGAAHAVAAAAPAAAMEDATIVSETAGWVVYRAVHRHQPAYLEGIFHTEPPRNKVGSVHDVREKQ